MNTQAVENQYNSLIQTIGKTAANALFPNDFPAYWLALELVDSLGTTVDYLSWPVLPDEIRDNQQSITKVTKTIGGVFDTKNPTYTPTQISLTGNFGRRFRILLGRSIEFAGIGLSIKSGKFDIKPSNILENTTAQFSSFAKTGYGCVKILEAISNKSRKVDNYNKPFSLYFYNPILGGNYQVEVMNFSHWQNSSNGNMIPQYSLQLTTVIPLDDLFSRNVNFKSALKNLGFNAIQKTANQSTGVLKSIPNLGL